MSTSTLEKISKGVLKLPTPTDKKIVFTPTALSIGVLLSSTLLYLIGIGFLTFAVFPVAIYYCFKAIHLASMHDFNTSVVKDFNTRQKFEKQYLVYMAVASAVPILLGLCTMNSSLTDGMQENLIAGFIVASLLSLIAALVSRLGFIYILEQIAKEVIKQEKITKMVQSK